MGEDTDDPLILHTRQIAEKYIAYFWRQARPYVPAAGGGEPAILLQNKGKQAAVVNYVAEARTHYTAGSTPRDLPKKQFERLLGRVASKIEGMPLKRLQRLAGGDEHFLYPNVIRDHTITLEPGVSFCFRRFHGLIHNLVKGAWLHFVR